MGAEIQAPKSGVRSSPSKYDVAHIGELKNEFSWSRSRGATFESCARRYWFTYYGSWGGWEKSAPPRVRQAYILEQLQTRWMWVGDAVHRTVARVLVSGRAGEAMAESVAVEEGLKGMREEYRASKQGKYRERPKKECGLYEHEYGVELTDAEWGEAADHFRACVGAYYKSPYAERLPKLPRGSWLPVEELDSFDFEGVKVYVRPDFAYRTGPDTAEIIDWKTGRKSDGRGPASSSPIPASSPRLPEVNWWLERATCPPSPRFCLWRSISVGATAGRSGCSNRLGVVGAGDRIRTGDVHLGKVAFCH